VLTARPAEGENGCTLHDGGTASQYVERYLISPLLTLLRQRLQRGDDGYKELHHDGCRDVGINAHGRNAELSQGAAGEQVQIAEDGVSLKASLRALGVDTGDRHVRDEAEHDENEECEHEPLANVRLLERLD
jgi:hypothetical protein